MDDDRLWNGAAAHTMTGGPLVLTAIEGGVARLTLNRPARHNSLVPELLDDFHAALDRVEAADVFALVLAANGRSFSTGGDVAGFAAVPRAERRAYADTLVGALNRAILRLLALPCPVIARVNGPVTGGSCGLVFAADLVAIAPPAFLASYYVDVGFGPDGGWTALLPEKIGASRAAAIQFLNGQIGPEAAATLGIATTATEPGGLDGQIAAWIATLRGKSRESLRATRALLMPPQRLDAIRAGLERERVQFLALVDTPQSETGMARFLARSA